jgi:hypothetical protein
MPFTEERTLLGHRADAARYRFSAMAGQTLHIHLDRRPMAAEPVSGGIVYVDLFRVDESDSDTGVRVTNFEIGFDSLSVPLAAAGEYVLRLRPDPLVDSYLGIRLELAAILEFPVAGHRITDVRSFFGDARDSGLRRHEGIDVYAPRSTPVVAVAGGRAVADRDEYGGRVVKLMLPNVTYYYAHLERVAVSGPKSVERGEVLGYVGDSGNAAGGPPHLHFAIFLDAGAVDPMPLIRAQMFEDSPQPTGAGAIVVDESPIERLAAEPRFVAADGRILWLPSHDRAPGDSLPALALNQASEPGIASRDAVRRFITTTGDIRANLARSRNAAVWTGVEPVERATIIR